MKFSTYLRDAAVFAPCYIALDWASYIDPVGPFNITPWNPQAALAIVWMILGGLVHAPAVLAAILLADLLVRSGPGGPAIMLATGSVLAGGYAAIAFVLRSVLSDTGLRSTRHLTFFALTVAAGTGLAGAAFIGVLAGASLLGATSFGNAWIRFWVGDAVGILVTAPLLFAAADTARRASLVRLLANREAALQALVLGGLIWLIFEGLGSDPSRQFYLLFLPMIWVAVRFGMNGAILATGIVQIGVVFAIHSEKGAALPVLELQALLVALTLTGLFLGLMVDQRERAEESLRESMRLAVAGEMAGAIAHEVNQPLTALINYGQAAKALLGKEGVGPRQVSGILDRILAEAERAAEIVRRLRDFFRAGTTRLEVVETAVLLASARRMADRAIDGAQIEFVVEESGPLCPLFVDKLQVEVVLRNLIANAVESIRGAGRTTGRIRISAAPEGASSLRFVIADDGPGISASARPALFEPFKSGKPTGMGLGLAISRAIAEAHGGSLQAVPAAHGEFHLLLPCARKT